VIARVGKLEEQLAALRQSQKAGRAEPRRRRDPGHRHGAIDGPGGPSTLLSGLAEGISADDLLAAFDKLKAREPRSAAVLLARADGRSRWWSASLRLSPGRAATHGRCSSRARILGGRGGGRPSWCADRDREGEAPRALAAMTRRPRLPVEGLMKEGLEGQV